MMHYEQNILIAKDSADHLDFANYKQFPVRGMTHMVSTDFVLKGFFIYMRLSKILKQFQEKMYPMVHFPIAQDMKTLCPNMVLPSCCIRTIPFEILRGGGMGKNCQLPQTYMVRKT